MLVDHERVLLDLKRHVASKPHHGQRELALVIAELEVRHQIEEGLPERALRLYGQELFEAVNREHTPFSERGCVSPPDGDQDRASRGDSSIQSEEDSNAHRGTSERSIRGRGQGTSRHAASRSLAAA